MIRSVPPRSALLPILLAAALPLAAGAAETPPADRPPPASTYQPIQPASQCLKPHRARDWAYVADDQIVVDAGRKLYRIEFSYGCPALAYGYSIRFDTGPGVGRICGHIHEAVLVRGARCQISRVTRIDRKTYEEVLSQPGVTLHRQVGQTAPFPFLASQRGEFGGALTPEDEIPKRGECAGCDRNPDR